MKVNLVNENFSSNYVENLLKARGVENVHAFLNPTIEYLQSPLDLKNIRLGAALYTRVVKSNGKILIVVDSDCDGYTSAAIIYQYTRRLNPNCQVDYWLHENKQHGLQDHIDKLMTTNEQYDLIILPDSSSNDGNYHDKLDTIGTPCLVLDHHETDVALSNNAIVINNQLSPNYRNKALTGAGVVYQFCRYIDSITGNNWADDYIDLAALGIIGDMGSVLELENRYIITAGLTEKTIRNSFLRCLLEKRAYSITGAKDPSWREVVAKTDSTAIAFYVVPMINAMIRVGSMPEKERLFLAFIDGARQVPCGKRGAKGTMERVDIESARECTNAKSKQDKIKETATEQLEVRIFKYDLLENKVLFVRLEEEDTFPAELNGLIATQLAVRFKKPTIVARLNDEGYVKGSARGVNQSELKDFKQFLTNSGFFEYAQGHANAFGISIPDANLRRFHSYANEALANINFGENVYDVNFVRESRDEDLAELIFRLGEASSLWGQQNAQPLIHVTNMIVRPSDIRYMGANADTVKIEINGIPYIKFHAKDLIQELRGLTVPFTMEIVGKPNLNEWMGRTTPQMFIEDYEIKPNTTILF